MKRTVSLLALVVGMVACGGETATTPEIKPPPTPSSAVSTTSAIPSATATTPVEAPKPTLAELHKKLGAQINAAWAARDVKKLMDLYADGATFGMPTAMGWSESKSPDIEKHISGFLAGFPDAKMAATRVIIKGDTMIAEWVTTGTNTGEFMGEKPTGKATGHRGISVMTIDKNTGKVVRETMYMDNATVMGHLGKADKNAKFRAVEALPSGEPEMVVAKDDQDAKNEAAVRALYQALEKKDEKAFLALVTDDVVHADYSAPADSKGKDAAKKEVAEMTKALPDLKLTAKNVWSAGDYVVVEGEMTGTLKGQLGPFKPTNKTATTHFVDVVKFVNGKISWLGTYGNGMEFVVQYGIVKLPAPKGSDGKPGDAKPGDGKKPDAKPTETKKPDTKPTETKKPELKK
jgi:predicted ester cyclase